MVFITYADSVADLGVAQALVYLRRTAENQRERMAARDKAHAPTVSR